MARRAVHTHGMSDVRRSGWVIRGGTDDDGWEIHLAFLLLTVLAVPTFIWLIVVAVRTSGGARLGAVVGATALGLLMAWTAGLLTYFLVLRRFLRSQT